jgi:hypothetical protein
MTNGNALGIYIITRPLVLPPMILSFHGYSRECTKFLRRALLALQQQAHETDEHWCGSLRGQTETEKWLFAVLSFQILSSSPVQILKEFEGRDRSLTLEFDLASSGLEPYVGRHCRSLGNIYVCEGSEFAYCP